MITENEALDTGLGSVCHNVLGKRPDRETYWLFLYFLGLGRLNEHAFDDNQPKSSSRCNWSPSANCMGSLWLYFFWVNLGRVQIRILEYSPPRVSLLSAECGPAAASWDSPPSPAVRAAWRSLPRHLWPFFSTSPHSNEIQINVRLDTPATLFFFHNFQFVTCPSCFRFYYTKCSPQSHPLQQMYIQITSIGPWVSPLGRWAEARRARGRKRKRARTRSTRPPSCGTCGSCTWKKDCAVPRGGGIGGNIFGMEFSQKIQNGNFDSKKIILNGIENQHQSIDFAFVRNAPNTHTRGRTSLSYERNNETRGFCRF